MEKKLSETKLFKITFEVKNVDQIANLIASSGSRSSIINLKQILMGLVENGISSNNISIIRYAICKEDMELIELIKSKGLISSDQTCFGVAIKNLKFNVAKYLVENGAPVTEYPISSRSGLRRTINIMMKFTKDGLIGCLNFLNEKFVFNKNQVTCKCFEQLHKLTNEFYCQNKKLVDPKKIQEDMSLNTTSNTYVDCEFEVLC